MQTFLPELYPFLALSRLDNKRLGKQRVEAIQIATCLLEEKSRWNNHPAVLMWKGYEEYLVLVYLQYAIKLYGMKGFKNTKCSEHYSRLEKYLKKENIIRPPWYNKDFVKAHQSNLLRKDYNYYSSYFNVPDNLPYLWPTRGEK
jgi:hypothetical protein